MTEERLQYRLLTGPDDRSFCEKVSRALKDGYVLYGSPSIAFNGERCIVAQAVIRPQRARSGNDDAGAG